MFTFDKRPKIICHGEIVKWQHQQSTFKCPRVGQILQNKRFSD